MSTEQERDRLKWRVIEARRTQFGTVEAAIRAAGINRATWQRVEAGESVRDDKLGAVEKALGWNPGDAWRIMAGKEPTVDMPATPEVSKHVTLRQQIKEDSTLPKGIRNAMLALLDSQELDDQEADPPTQGEVRAG
jgi:hypothetical protein